MKKITPILWMIVLGFCGPVFGQSSTDEEGITKLLAKLFRGMELGDSAMVSSTFTKNATMVTVSQALPGSKETVVRQNPNALKDFLNAVGTPHDEIWYEEIWDIKIQADGDFAQVWCDYAFYRGKKNFSHCGADAFHAYKGSGGWKFFHLAYSIRKEGCNIPEAIKVKHQ